MEVGGATAAQAVRIAGITRTSAPRPTARTIADGYAWARVGNDARDLQAEVVALRRLLETSTSSSVGRAAQVSSSSHLDLAVGSHPSVLRSRERVNTDRTTFDPEEPPWSGDSTAAATISGADTGGVEQSYTFGVDKASRNANQPSKIEVLDENGQVLDKLQVDASDLGTTTFDLSSGLTVRFSDGSFEENDTFVVDVFPERYEVIDPDHPLDGTEASSANLEEGFVVGDGAITVNGTSVEVNGSDSIHDVLARITATTDVSATFDEATQTVAFTHDEVGALPIDLVDVGSGFLAAMKLDGADVVPGERHDADQPMATVPALSAVTGGDLEINGVRVAIDPTVDSLEDALARIDASDAGVSASLSAGRVTITNRDRRQPLVLVDETGLLHAVGIEPDTYQPTGRAERGMSSAGARRVADATAAVGQAVDRLLRTAADGDTLRRALSNFGRDARRHLVTAFDLADNATRARAGGLRIDLRDGAVGLFDTTISGRRDLASTLREDDRAFRDAMLEPRDGGPRSFLDELERMAAVLVTRARLNLDVSL